MSRDRYKEIDMESNIKENDFQLDGNKLLRYNGSDETVTVPEGVEVIGMAAFASCYTLKSIVLPESLRVIESLAFFNCINLEMDLDSSLSDKIAPDAFLGCTSIKKETYVLKEMTVSEIEKLKHPLFYVKDYQRGYRWSTIEIEELLSDINETEGRYCLQPLVVKLTSMGKYKNRLDKDGRKESDESDSTKTVYELIDGQQRLTTLLLILRALGEVNEPKYSIYYELLRNMDGYYIDKAEETIKNWLEKKFKSKPDEYCSFAKKIRDNLFFIWYEMKADGIVVENEFRNINDGQTPLTNAELFKALLLNPENAEEYAGGYRNEVAEKLYEMALEWDSIEQSLHNEKIWFFIANSECTERTHLDYLFELYAKRIGDLKVLKGYKKEDKTYVEAFLSCIQSLDSNRDRFSFLSIKAYIDLLSKHTEKNIIGKFKIIRDVWRSIVLQYHRLCSWFSDPELYHCIGYLVAIEERRRSDSVVPDIVTELFCKGFGEKIVPDYAEDLFKTETDYSSGLSELRVFVREKIKEHLKHQIEDKENKSGESNLVLSDNYYKRNKKDIRDFLLFVNVWSTFRAKESFPFDRYKNTRNDKDGKLISWDIEHVAARNLKKDISDDEIKKIRPWWKKELEAELEGELPGSFKLDRDEWEKFADRVNEQEPDNRVANLVLLDSKTNRSYGDALFFGKREEIIDRDRKNAYIPICTKNVFLKYYTDDPDMSSAWTERDRMYYFEVILKCIGEGIYQDQSVPKTVQAKLKEIEAMKEAKK